MLAHVMNPFSGKLVFASEPGLVLIVAFAQVLASTRSSSEKLMSYASVTVLVHPGYHYSLKNIPVDAACASDVGLRETYAVLSCVIVIIVIHPNVSLISPHVNRMLRVTIYRESQTWFHSYAEDGEGAVTLCDDGLKPN